MAERSTLTQLVQLGMESSPGTAVAATKRLMATAFEFGPSVDVQTWRGSGYKYPSVTGLQKEWTEGTFSGPITYTELVYFLCGLVKNVTPSGATLAKTWTFSPATTSEDTVKTFTIEQGSAVRAAQIAYGLITGLTLSFGDGGAELSGDFIGQAMTDGHTMTSSGVTEVALVPVTRIQTGIKLADTSAGLAGASYLTRPLSAEWSLTNRFAPIWALNQSTSFPVHIETEPSLEVKLLLQADATGMGLLDTMRANSTKFMRIEAIGAVIESAVTYQLTIDTAFRVTDVSELRDEDGVFAIEWTGVGVHDATFTKAFNITVVNEVASL